MKAQFLGLLVGVSLTWISSSALAALGDQMVTTSSATTSSGRSTLSTSAGSSYSVVDSVEDGMNVRQYLDSRGVVFAISWKGKNLPPLATLLGTYLPEYKAELSSRPKQFGRKTLKVSTKNIVVEGSSRQMDQRGRAYIPSRLPEGFDIKDINSNE
ncbi:DUF2844 domain-containing protein [Bdellovibrio sp. HCB209]|uniref:DUF2844 domain-containing protein n=1 Tax=Bdellovibrio sp. HCB209 TaxID=3394354 RepID=UPI0039B6024B